MRKEKSCGALVYHFESPSQPPNLLLIKHKNGGHWSFPKGHVEDNETEQETALREIREETGLNVTLLDGFRQAVSYNPKSTIEKEVVYFVAKAKSSRLILQEEEIGYGTWVPFEKASRMVTYENDRVLIAAAVNFLKNKDLGI